MHKDLILKAFKKAADSLEDQGVPSPSKRGMAEVLSDYIERECNFPFGERRLRDYYKAALEGEEIEIKQQAVRDGLSRYLGYESFSDLLVKTHKPISGKEEAGKTKGSKVYFLSRFLQGNRTTLFIALGCLLVFLIVNSINEKKWMVWEGNRYVETDFDPREMEKGHLLLFNENQIQHFKKIKPDCNTQFFTSEGRAQLWYGKNKKGELEYFTDLGRHPETGKTLKPITRYMIEKYICEER